MVVSLRSERRWQMRRISRVASALLITLSLCVATAPSGQAAKAGKKCSKAGVIMGAGAQKLTCVKKGKSFIWKKTPESVLGSVSSPIPFGTSLKIGSIEYSISGVNISADELICKGNSFNKGCTVDDRFNTIVDPKSQTSWVTIKFNVKNLGNQIVKPGALDKNFFVVLSNGQLLEQEIFAMFPQSLFEVQVIPGGSAIGEVPFALPKSGASLSNLLVLRDSSDFFKQRDYYFQVRW
jgi:hypothetical protein